MARKRAESEAWTKRWLQGALNGIGVFTVEELGRLPDDTFLPKAVASIFTRIPEPSLDRLIRKQGGQKALIERKDASRKPNREIEYRIGWLRGLAKKPKAPRPKKASKHERAVARLEGAAERLLVEMRQGKIAIPKSLHDGLAKIMALPIATALMMRWHDPTTHRLITDIYLESLQGRFDLAIARSMKAALSRDRAPRIRRPAL